MRDTSCTLAHDCTTCRPSTTPPAFPSTKSYLLINGKPHRSKIDIDLRHSFQDRQLRLHITEREDWAPATFHLVHWPTIQTWMNRSINHQKRAAIKLSFRQWATESELHKRTPSHDHQYKRCRRHTGKFDHIFKCNKSQLATTGTVSVLREFLRTSLISRPMTRCIIQGIQQWLIDGNEPYDFSTHPTNAHLHLVHLAYIDQSSIGWGNLLRGRIATAWLRAHDQYYSLRHLHDKYSTTHFAPALVRHLWDFSLAIWKHRNDEVHGATDDAAKEKQEKILDATITAAYQQPDRHSDADRLVLVTKSLPTD